MRTLQQSRFNSRVAHLRHVLLHSGLSLCLCLSMGRGLGLQIVRLRSLLQALGLGLEAVGLAHGLLLSAWAGLMLALSCQPGCVRLHGRTVLGMSRCVSGGLTPLAELMWLASRGPSVVTSLLAALGTAHRQVASCQEWG